MRVMIPGVVQRYDATTKRAVIQPAIMRDFKDRRPSIAMAPLVDVPVVSNATGGFMIHQQINAGDIMMVVFTDRGLDAFKQTWQDGAEPTKGKRFDDAVAIRWGVETIEPVSTEGVVIQNAAGTSYIHLKDDEIRLKVGSGNARLTSSNFDTWRG